MLDLLNQVGCIIEKYNSNTSKQFNIFEVAGIDTRETIICRIIAELLDPLGQHGQKSKFLKIFLESCLEYKQFSEAEIDDAIVSLEFPVDNSRRIDIVIQVGCSFIPIEVKINADDLPSQCFDYCKFARKKDSAAKIVYLSVDIHAPPPISRRGCDEEYLEDKDILNISFGDHIINWIQQCIALTEKSELMPLRVVLIQFLAAIQNFTKEKYIMAETFELLYKSERNMRSAVKIAISAEECKKEMIRKFYEAVEENLGSEVRLKKRLTKGNGDYKSLEPVQPLASCINYFVKHIDNCNLDIGLRIEIYDDLCVGFGLVENGLFIQLGDRKDSDEIMSLFCRRYRVSPWYISYDLVFYGEDKDKTINFRSCNDNYFKLFSEDTFSEIVKATVKKTKSMLDTLRLL